MLRFASYQAMVSLMPASREIFGLNPQVLGARSSIRRFLSPEGLEVSQTTFWFLLKIGDDDLDDFPDRNAGSATEIHGLRVTLFHDLNGAGGYIIAMNEVTNRGAISPDHERIFSIHRAADERGDHHRHSRDQNCR